MVEVLVWSVALFAMGRAGTSATTGHREVRSERMFFLRNSQSLQRLVNSFCQRRELRSGFDSNPEDASRFCGGKESVAAEAHVDWPSRDIRESSLDSFHGLLRLFANEFQGDMQRLGADPPRIRREAAYSFHEALDALSDCGINVESNENALCGRWSSVVGRQSFVVGQNRCGQRPTTDD